LVGYDATHRLGIQFDGVNLEEGTKISAAHADILLGPGAANFRPSGQDVKVAGAPGKGTANTCADKFVPFPVPISTKRQ
jgi:hypothetical protein